MFLLNHDNFSCICAGSNTYVTSIKYKRKYDDIITTQPKPGFVNHYEGY